MPSQGISTTVLLSVLTPHKNFLIHTPRITFAAPPPCLALPHKKPRLKSVKRLYTIARVKGVMKFTCSHFAHHVSTLDFGARVGNLRTQAATAINSHPTTVHHEPSPSSPP